MYIETRTGALFCRLFLHLHILLNLSIGTFQEQ